MIVYHTFRSTATIIYILQPNGDNHWNHKGILNQTGGGTFQKNLIIFMHKVLMIIDNARNLQQPAAPLVIFVCRPGVKNDQELINRKP